MSLTKLSLGRKIIPVQGEFDQSVTSRLWTGKSSTFLQCMQIYIANTSFILYVLYAYIIGIIGIIGGNLDILHMNFRIRIRYMQTCVFVNILCTQVDSYTA
jgi:hypothetical protein